MWFTLEEIAALKGVSIPHLRNLAWRDKWRRLNLRPQRYHIHDVMETFNSAK